jgi:hypothetical protein
MRIATVLFFALVLCLPFSAPRAQNYVATINSAQEVPPTGSTATGLGCFMLDASSMLHYDIAYSGLSAPETGAHIHGPAPAGANAGVMFPLPGGSPKVGMVGPLSAQQIADLNAGRLYVNIHSQNFPGGEIRGQILSSLTPCTTPVEDRTWGAIKAFYNIGP